MTEKPVFVKVKYCILMTNFKKINKKNCWFIYFRRIRIVQRPYKTTNENNTLQIIALHTIGGGEGE